MAESTENLSTLAGQCSGSIRPQFCRALARRKVTRISRAFGLVCLFALWGAVWELAEQRVVPVAPQQWHDRVLVVSGALATLVGCGVAYLPGRREQRKASAKAEQLIRVLRQYQSHPSSACHFDNPDLVHCRVVHGCEQADCPMFDAPGQRCWQVMALRRAPLDHLPPVAEIQRCLECPVFQLSCPDKLTELGESFNNLIFLLEQGTEHVGQLRGQVLEKQKMAALGQIAAGVAHEVGNPLSSISSIVQTLKRERPAGTLAEQLSLIDTHISRISSIVRQLVTMARPGSEQWELTDVSQVLDEIVRLIAFDSRARRIHIDLEPGESLPSTYALRGQLQQVFINLALNALDAMPEGGTLRIRAQRSGGNMHVRVRDTGCGIPPATGRRVFEPFYTTKSPGHGTGLGLAVSYGIVQKHGGNIELSSELGQGTEFTVEIPILDSPPDGQHA